MAVQPFEPSPQRKEDFLLLIDQTRRLRQRVAETLRQVRELDRQMHGMQDERTKPAK